MTTTLAPSPLFRQWDNNGNPLAGGQLFTYAAGTSTPVPTYADSVGTVNPNPVILNNRGEAQVWLQPNVAYKFTLTDSQGNQIWSVDQIVNSQLITLYGGVDTGSTNAYLLNFTASFTSYTDGIVVYWIAGNTNTGASTINVNGLGVVSLTNPDGTALFAGQITANAPQTMIFKGGAFFLLSPSYIQSSAKILGNLTATGTAAFGSSGANGVQAWGPTAAALVDMTPDKGTFTGTLSGMTGTPGTVTGTFNWIKMGNYALIYVIANISGTSNSANMALSGMPAEILPAQTVVGAICAGSITDNGVSCSAVCIPQSNGSFQLGKNAVSGANVVSATNNFTNSGTKGVSIGFAFLYPLV